MDADEIDREMKRIRAQGRELNGPPTAKQDLLARMLDPGAWTAGAQEHIDWGARHNRLYPTISFGGQFSYRRGIAFARAAEMLDALERLDRGEPQIERLDLRALGDRLQKESPYDRDSRTPRAKAMLNLRMLNAIDGIAAPCIDDHKDGFTLRWSLRHGTAIIRIGADSVIEGSIEPPRADLPTWRESVHSEHIAALIGNLLRLRPDTDPRGDQARRPIVVGDAVARSQNGSPAPLLAHHVRDALVDATTLYEHESDNDTEAMFITRGGQYVRRTGQRANRFYVLEREDARDVANGYLDDIEMDLLMP